MTENERQQRMVERIQEDERLRGDLEDEAASALLAWAIERVEAATADNARPDSEVEADVQVVRAAARAAARSGESDPQRLIALAEATLAQQRPATTSAASTPAPIPASAGVESTPGVKQPRQEAPQPPTPPDRPAVPAAEGHPAIRRRRRNRIANWLKRKRGGR